MIMGPLAPTRGYVSGLAVTSPTFNVQAHIIVGSTDTILYAGDGGSPLADSDVS